MIFFISILLSTVLHWTELATRPVNVPIKGEPLMEIVLLGENSNKTYFELDSSKYVPFKSHSYFFSFSESTIFLNELFFSVLVFVASSPSAARTAALWARTTRTSRTRTTPPFSPAPPLSHTRSTKSAQVWKKIEIEINILTFLPLLIKHS